MLSRSPRWSRLARTCLDALLPSACALCGCSTPQLACPCCRERFFKPRAARCPSCGVAVLTGRQLCGACLRRRPAFDATVTAVDYAPPLDQLVLGLKFGKRLELASLFAEQLHAAWEDQGMDRPDMLIPVPLGARRLVERGFNQALEIAKPLGHALGIPVRARLVQRIRETEAQALLPHSNRRANVKGAFGIVPRQSVKGLHVGVVDDVMTTGETLDAVARLLKRAGATRVTNFAFARTSPA